MILPLINLSWSKKIINVSDNQIRPTFKLKLVCHICGDQIHDGEIYCEKCKRDLKNKLFKQEGKK